MARLTPGASTQQLQLTAPAALTTYVVRAFAASASGDVFGSEETELIVRRVVSLTPSVPRLLRTGDNGTAGVVVTFSGTATQAAPVTVTVSVASSGPVRLTSAAEAALVFDGSLTQQETRFDLTALTTGDVQLTFSAEAAAGSDSVQVELPSLLTQAPVVVATSFAVTPSPQGFQEGLDIPAAVPGEPLTAGPLKEHARSDASITQVVSGSHAWAHSVSLQGQARCRWWPVLGTCRHSSR